MPASGSGPLIVGLHHVAFAEGPRGPRLGALQDLLNMTPEHVETGDGFVERMLPVGSCWLQFLEPTAAGVVRRSIERRGEGFHHVAFAVSDLEKTMQVLRGRSVEFIDTQPREGGMATTIAFAHPRSFGGLLVEFVQGGRNPRRLV